jgi:DNA-directed RNA polymerase subunit K/omega
MLNIKYLKRAQAKMPDSRRLVIAITKRTRMLSHGGKPMIKIDPNTMDKEGLNNNINVALLEMAEGLLALENV